MAPTNNPPPFLDPPDREPVGPYTGMTQEPVDVPAITQQHVDLANSFKRALSDVSSIADQLANNLDRGIAGALSSSVDHANNLDRSMKRVNETQQDHARQSQQILEWETKRAAAAERIRDAEQSGVTALRRQFQTAGMIRNQAPNIISYLDENNQRQTIPLAQYQTLARQGANLSDEQQKQLGRIREQLQSGLALSPEEDTTFNIGQLIGHLAHGNVGLAVSEALQSFSKAQGFTRFTTGIGENLINRSTGSGLLGMAGRGIGSGIISGGEFLASPAGVFLLQREIREGIRTYQEDLRQGMQGGLQGGAAVRETIGANIQARIEGLNPFDALTTQMAKQIAAGIQSEGFTGAIRAAWQDSVTDVVKSTGIDAGTALQLMSTSANQLGESANQFRQDMNLVENAAKNTDFSVTQLAQSMQQLQQSFVQRGGVAAAQPAAQLSTLLANALGAQGTQGRAGLSSLEAAIANPQAWQLMVGRVGISPLLATARSTLDQSAKILDQLGAMFWQMYQAQANGLPLRSWIIMMLPAFQAFLPGADENAIESFMRASKNGGFEQTQLRHTAENAPGPVQHHRGFLGSIVHGAAHLYTSAEHGIETGIGAVDTGMGDVIAGTAGELGASGATQRAIRNQIGGLPPWLQTKVYNDYSTAATRSSQLAYWRNQAQSMGLSAAETRRLLAPTQQAESISELNRASQTAQTILLKLHPQAARYFEASPGSVQTYYNSLNGSSGTQYMTRPPGGR